MDFKRIDWNWPKSHQIAGFTISGMKTLGCITRELVI
jgi:hypothetical protein